MRHPVPPRIKDSNRFGRVFGIVVRRANQDSPLHHPLNYPTRQINKPHTKRIIQPIPPA